MRRFLFSIPPPGLDWVALAAPGSLGSPEEAENAKVVFFHPPPLDWAGWPGQLRGSLGSPEETENVKVFLFHPPLGPPTFGKWLSECLAFLTPTQNYFELDRVFSSHP